jgi:exosortase
MLQRKKALVLNLWLGGKPLEKITLSQPSRLQALRNSAVQITILKSAALAFAVITLYFQDLRIIFIDALQNEATSYILLVPILFAYLIYRKRKMLVATTQIESRMQERSTRHTATLSGVLLCIISLTLYMYGSQTFTPLQYHIATLPFFTAGIFLIMFNPQTLRQAIFPIAFIAFLTPPPSETLTTVGSTLSVASTEAANAIANFLGIRSWISSNFGTPTINIIRPDNTTMSFAIDIACSGIYSLIGFLIFAGFIAYIAREKTWKKITIFAIGFPLIYLLNIIRISLIVLIGYQWGPQLALDIFHLLGGWVLIFLGTLTLLVLAEKALKIQIFTKKTTNTTCNNCAPRPPTHPYCPSCGRILKKTKTKFRIVDATKIAAIIAVMLLIAYIQTPVFALTQSPAKILVQTPNGQQGNALLLPQIQNYTLEFVYRDTEFEQLSGQDFSLYYLYQPQQKGKMTVWVSIEIAETTVPLHAWEICLIDAYRDLGHTPPVSKIDLRDITILENPPIIARYFAFQQKSDNQTQLVLYWYASALFSINNSTQQKHVKLSLIAYPDKPEDVPAMEEQLLPFAKAIVAYWIPLKTWNTITMLLTQNSLQLATLTTAILIALLIFHFIQTKRQRKVNVIAYQKLSKPNKQIIDAVQETEKKTTSTLDKIADTYQKTTDQVIGKDQLLQKLAELEKIGILKSHIKNKQDEPTLTWKTQI